MVRLSFLVQTPVCGSEAWEVPLFPLLYLMGDSAVPCRLVVPRGMRVALS